MASHQFLCLFTLWRNRDGTDRSRAAGRLAVLPYALPLSSLQPEMSDTGLTVLVMTELLRRYDVTITVDRDGDHLPNPAEFAMAAKLVASARAVSVVSAHTRPARSSALFRFGQQISLRPLPPP